MKFVHHIEPVPPSAARGVTAEVYAHARKEFGRLPEPVSMLSPDENLLAAWWVTLRESLIAGHAPRARKEAIAAAIAANTRCPWCIDAHTTMLYATGESATANAILANEEVPVGEPTAPYVDWATGTATPNGPAAPFGSEHAAEYLATAMAFHFVVRLVLVLLDETFLVGGTRTQSLMRKAGGLVLARKARMRHPTGLASRRFARRPLPEDLRWAAASAPIATGLAELTHCLHHSPHLPAQSRDAVQGAVRAWQGEPTPISSRWTDEHTAALPEDLRGPTRLALLTALSPHQVTADDVAAARQLLDTDALLVNALAWSAWTAARRIDSWTTRPTDSQLGEPA